MLLKKFKILGHSMQPTFKDGDKILISEVPYIFKKPKIGDIVAAKKDKNILIKRVTKISNERYFIQGENINDSFDSRTFGHIKKNQILGKVIYKF